MTEEKQAILEKQFAEVINKNSIENESNTPDFILGKFLVSCLLAHQEAARKRDNWYGGKQSIREGEKKSKWQ